MAVFELQGPDGSVYEVDAPDEAAAIGAFQQMLAPQQPAERSAVARTPDGGTIWEMPGGKRVFSSPNYSTSDPAQVEKLMQGATPANVSMHGWDQQIIGESPVAARALKAVEGTPFVGSYADEAAGAVFGEDARDAWRMTSKAMDREKPWQSAGLQLAGGLATAVPAAMVAGPGVMAQSLGGNMVRGAALGVGEGAARGYGRGEGSAESRFAPAATDAAFGGAVGFVAPAVAHGVGALAGAFRNRLAAARGINRVSGKVGISNKAGQQLSEALARGDQGLMDDALRAAGPNAMLADASPSTQGLLDMIIQSPGEGARTARTRIDARAGESYNGIMDALVGGQQGPRIPPATMQNRMAESARGAVNPAYSRAYGTPIDYASPEGMAIEELISRVPPEKVKAAVKSATDRMVYDGLPAPQILANVADDGTVSLSQLPNVMQLDYLKRAFDEVAEDSKDAITGRMTSDGAFASRIARDVREATKEAVPAYGEALEVAASDIRQRGAVRTGQRILSPSTTVEDALGEIANATGAEKRAMRDGLIGQIDHVLGNVRAVASDQNIEPRQAMEALRELSSPNAQRKMEALFGDQWPSIQQSIDQGSAALGLRARVSANSQTFARGEAKEAFDAAFEPGALRKGEPINAGRAVWQRATGATPTQIQNMRASVRDELADVLTRPGAKGLLDQFANARAAFPLLPDAGAGVRNVLLATGFGATPALAEQLRKRLLRQWLR